MSKQEYIKLWTVKRATKDMQWWTGKKINWKRYYTYEQAIETSL